MRPLRALAGLGMLVGLWLWWRAPTVRAELAHLGAAAHFGAARMHLVGGNLAQALAEARRGLADEPFAAEGLALVRKLRALAMPARTFAAEPVIVLPAVPRPHDKEPASPRIRLGKRDSDAAVPAISEVLAIVDPVPVPPVASNAIAEAVPRKPPGDDMATAAYRLLSEGRRREAATAFHAAVAAAPGDSRAAGWSRQLAALEKRLSGSAYIFARASGTSELAATPVLGGGQSGAQVAYSLDPLSSRPLAVEARVSAPNNDVKDGAQAALGVTWRLRPSLSLTAERLFAAGDHARGGWTVRAAGGAATVRQGGARRWLDASIYAEGGIVGLRDPAYYGAAQGRVGRSAAIAEDIAASVGMGGWASVQRDRRTVSRFEVGPTLHLSRGAFNLTADYRVRLAGNAAPGSGPALTLAAFF